MYVQSFVSDFVADASILAFSEKASLCAGSHPSRREEKEKIKKKKKVRPPARSPCIRVLFLLSGHGWVTGGKACGMRIDGAMQVREGKREREVCYL